MDTAPAWITAVATAISSAAIVLLWMQTSLLKDQGKTALSQLDLLKKQIGDDHERSRREHAIALLQHWITQLNRELSTAARLVQKLDKNQCRKLFAKESIKIPSECHEMVATCLHRSGIETVKREGDFITLQEAQVGIIRWQAISYLNNLEIVMAAWRHNSADREMLAEQFEYLVDDTEGYDALENLRNAGGEAAFPAIAEFCEHIKGKRKTKGKEALGKGTL